MYCKFDLVKFLWLAFFTKALLRSFYDKNVLQMCFGEVSLACFFAKALSRRFYDKNVLQICISKVSLAYLSLQRKVSYFIIT